MKILWFTWKDKKNPYSGGAEVVNEELAKKLALNGHDVILLVSGFSGAYKEEIIDGYKIIRLGNRWTVYLEVYKYYKNNLVGWADLVIDEVNTIPFFAKFYVKENNILFVHQLCREIWFYQIFFPLNIIGYFIEPLYLLFIKDRRAITVSESSKKDLMRFGFKEGNIHIITQGIELKPLQDISLIHKFGNPTILSLGTIRSMKRTHHIIKAFEKVKENIGDAELIIAGSLLGQYGQRITRLIKKSKYHNSIQYLGKISEVKKIELLQKSHIVAITSLKEGWGLVATEANSQGTPVVVYNVDGLQDSVKNNETGLICDYNNPKNLSEKMKSLLQNKEFYEKIRLNAWQNSKKNNFEESYNNFMRVIHAE